MMKGQERQFMNENRTSNILPPSLLLPAPLMSTNNTRRSIDLEQTLGTATLNTQKNLQKNRRLNLVWRKEEKVSDMHTPVSRGLQVA
jgi:hypothetical protein